MTTITQAAVSRTTAESSTLVLEDGHDGAANAQRWLYELEHASLAQGQATVAPSTHNASRQPNAPARGPVLKAVSTPAIPQGAPFWTPTVPVLDVAEPLPPLNSRPMLSAIANQPADHAMDASDDALQSPSLTPPLTTTTTIAARMKLDLAHAVTSAMFTDVQKPVKPYAPQNLHVYADGETLQVWVRDAQLTPQAAEALRAGLVGAVARADNKTVKISINGKPASRLMPDTSMTLPAKTGLIF